MAQRNDVINEELRERSSEEIRQDIYERRVSLSNTIGRLGSRIQEKLDWREQVSQHPYLAMGAAAGLGFLLSGIFKPSPTPGKRIIRDSFQGLFHKIRPDMITMLSTIIFQFGGDFLLTKIKKNTSDYKKNGNEVHNEEVNMRKNDGFNTEINKPEEGGFAPVSESKRSQKSSATQSGEFGSDPDLTDRAEEFYGQAKKTVSDTCNKTTETLNKTYDQAIAYGRANPGKLALVALGSGLVIGLLLANRSKARQGSVETVVDTLSQGFSDFVRRHWG